MTSVGHWSVLQGALESTFQNSHSIGRLRLQRNAGERTEVNGRSRPGSGRCRGNEVRSDHELLVLRSRLGSGRCWGNEVRSDHELLVLPFMMQCHPMRKEDDPTVGTLRVSPMGDNRVCAWEGAATRALICRAISPFGASRLDDPRSRVRVPRPPSLTAWLPVLRRTRSAAVARLARLARQCQGSCAAQEPSRCHPARRGAGHGALESRSASAQLQAAVTDPKGPS